jgi:hypothetical protein
MHGKVIGLFALATLLSGCDPTDAEKARWAVMDNDHTPVKSCAEDDVQSATIGNSKISLDQYVQACKLFSGRRGRIPAVSELRNFGATVSLLRSRGLRAEPLAINGQLHDLIELRKQKDAPSINGTLRVAWVVFDSTNGEISPSELTAGLREGGQMVAILTDEQIATFAISGWKSEKNRR